MKTDRNDTIIAYVKLKSYKLLQVKHSSAGIRLKPEPLMYRPTLSVLPYSYFLFYKLLQSFYPFSVVTQLIYDNVMQY